MNKKHLLIISIISLLITSGAILVFSDRAEALIYGDLDEIDDVQQDIKNEAWGSLVFSTVDASTHLDEWVQGNYDYNSIEDTKNFMEGAYNWVMDSVKSFLGDDSTQNSATIYDYASYMSQDSQNILDIQSNHIKDVRNLVWSKVKYNTIKNLNNGTSVTTTKIKASDSVEDTYTRIQKNLVLQLSQQMKTLKHLQEMNNNQSTDLDHFAEIYVYVDAGAFGSTRDYHPIQVDNFFYRNVTLLNGTNVSVLDYPVQKEMGQDGTGASCYANVDIAPYPDESGTTYVENDWSVNDVDLRTRSFSTADPFTIWRLEPYMFDSPTWEGTFDLVDPESSMMKDNAEEFVNQTYNEYQYGELNISDIIDPGVLVENMNTKFNQTGYYGYAGAQLAMMGVNSSVQERFTIHVYESQAQPQWEGEDVTGMILTDHGFNHFKPFDGVQDLRVHVPGSGNQELGFGKEVSLNTDDKVSIWLNQETLGNELGLTLTDSQGNEAFYGVDGSGNVVYEDYEGTRTTLYSGAQAEEWYKLELIKKAEGVFSLKLYNKTYSTTFSGAPVDGNTTLVAETNNTQQLLGAETTEMSYLARDQGTRTDTYVDQLTIRDKTYDFQDSFESTDLVKEAPMGLIKTINRNNQLERGQIYNTSTWMDDELIYLVNGQGVHKLHTTFEILDITQYSTGESLANVSFESYNRQTLNTTNLSTQFDTIMELYNETEDFDSEGTTGETSDDGTTIDDAVNWFTSTYLGFPVWIWLVGIGFGFVAVRGYFNRKGAS